MPKNDDLQQQLLNVLSMKGDISVSEMAELLGQTDRVVQYQLNKLLAEGHIRRTFIIDQRALGLQTCNVIFNLPAEQQEAALQFLERQDSVAWLFQNLGEREFEISANLKSASELSVLMKGLSEGAGTRFHDQSFAFDDDMICWGYRFAVPEYQKVPPTVFRNPEVFKADELDLRILRAGRSSPNSNLASLARSLGQSTSTIRYRLDALEKAKVISNPRYFLVQSSSTVQQAQIRLSVRLRTSEKEREIIEMCQNLPQATSLTTCVGDWDYKIVLHAQSSEGLIEARDKVRLRLADNLNSLHFCLRRRWLKSSAGV